MINAKFRGLACSLLFVLAAAPLGAEENQLPEVTEDGLHRVHDAKLAIVYAEPGAELSAYRRVQLLDAYVAFRKNWERDQRSRTADPLALTSNDISRIKENLSQEFQGDGGFAVHLATPDRFAQKRDGAFGVD